MAKPVHTTRESTSKLRLEHPNTEYRRAGKRVLKSPYDKSRVKAPKPIKIVAEQESE